MVFFQTGICGGKPKLLWFDATANFQRFCSVDSIHYYLDMAQKCGFTDIVLDVKPITGEVLYPSRVAPQMKDWQGSRRSDSLDYLNVFITGAHRRGMRLHASLNVFVAGHNFFNRGAVYNNKAEWQCINYTDSGFVPITKLKHKYSAMTNPILKAVQKHELAVLKELVAAYPDLDGIILDRVRYDCIEADFSAASRAAFEKYIRKKVASFPNDIMFYAKDSSGRTVRMNGPLFKQWIEWRVSVIYQFIKRARETVKAINPKISFGDYTGAWYPLYYELGVNWASRAYDPSKEYSWATEQYKNYGYAELLDLYTSGCYFYEVTKEEVAALNEDAVKRGEAAMGKGKEYWYSVEGSAELAKQVVGRAVPVYGGLYVEQYKGAPGQFIRAARMCLEKTDGLMIFDIVHIINYGWWEVLLEAAAQ
jgi:hypothetical protein